MSIEVESNEEKHRKQEEEQELQDLKKRYKDRWNIKDPEQFYTRDTEKPEIDFPPIDVVPVGEVWEDNNGKKWKRRGNHSWTQVSKMDLYRPDTCDNCERMLSNSNEISLNMSTGKCYKCHAKEEKMKIVNDEEYDAPEWRKDILIQDSFGNIKMNIREYREEFGELNTYIFLHNLINGMDKKREEDVEVNEHIYNTAKVLMEEIKVDREEDISVLEDIISDFKEEGIIKGRILTEEVQKITEEFHKRKGNAKELEIIKKQKQKKDIRKLI